MSCELPDIQTGFRKGQGTKDEVAKLLDQRKCKKNIYFCFIDYAKAFDCVDHNKLWQILQEILINLYAGQEGTVRTGHGTRDWFQIGKGVRRTDSLEKTLMLGKIEGRRRRG